MLYLCPYSTSLLNRTLASFYRENKNEKLLINDRYAKQVCDLSWVVNTRENLEVPHFMAKVIKIIILSRNSAKAEIFPELWTRDEDIINRCEFFRNYRLLQSIIYWIHFGGRYIPATHYEKTCFEWVDI